MIKLTTILQSPFFLALIVTLIIIPFLPEIFDKYKTELIDSERMYEPNKIPPYKQIVYYNDLDNDGKSEKIIGGYAHSLHDFKIYNNDEGIIDQINPPPPPNILNYHLFFGDYNNDGLNEMYYFIIKGDSILIRSLEPLRENAVQYMKQAFIDTVWKKSSDGKYDAHVSIGKLIDLNNDNYKEVVFTVNTGFSLQPRNLYAWDIANDTVLKSPKSGSGVNALLFDLNNDGKKEIISYSTIATGNLPEDFPYSDQSAWLMVFDNTLNFLFEPVEFPLFNSHITAVPYRTNKETYIAVLYQYYGKEKKKPALYLYNAKGEKVKEKIFPKENKKRNYYGITTFSSEERNRLYLFDLKGNMMQLNEKLDTINEIKIGKSNEKWFPNPWIKLDIDGDGEEELFFTSYSGWNKLMITRNDFSHPVIVNTPFEDRGVEAITLKLNRDNRSYLSVQWGENWQLLNYHPNPLYYTKYLVYLGIYAGLFLFIYIVQKITVWKLEQDKKNLEKTVEKRTEEIRNQKEELVVQKVEIETQRDDIIEKSKKLETANEEIETKNKEITDSIRYAEHIQQAILPPLDEIREGFSSLLGEDIQPKPRVGKGMEKPSLLGGFRGLFILFKPKDIVSGDFYFYAKVRSTIIIAACDCTGHGVPGAFMSMIGSRLLDDIVYDKKIIDAAQVLNQLRKGIIHALGKAGATGEQKDGMDMALCAFRHDQKNGNTKLQYAGAYNPLYIIRNDKNTQNSDGIEIIKADRQPVGYYEDKEEQPFTNHEIELQKGDTIYIFSDGYQDQFGSIKDKKFSQKRFRELLYSIYEKPMKTQKQILDTTIEEWKSHMDPVSGKNFKQTDDILVIGMRF